MKSLGQALEMEVNLQNMIEIWKPIKGYEGLYEISNYGNVKVLYFKNNLTNQKIYKPRLKKVRKDKYGYLVVTLHKNQKSKTYKIHRLVAEAFIKNPKNKPQINHKDGNKQNNYINNLEWCNNRENIKHAYKIGLQKPSYKKIFQFDLNNNFIKEWEYMKLASEQLKINYGDIVQCCKGRRKTAGGYKWRYVNEKS